MTTDLDYIGENHLDIDPDFNKHSSMFIHIVNKIFSEDTQQVQVKKVIFAQSQNFEINSARSYLPLSSQTLTVKQNRDGSISLQSASRKDRKPHPDFIRPRSRKLEVQAEEAELFVELLRLTQVSLLAHVRRQSNIIDPDQDPGSCKIPLPLDLLTALEILEYYMDGGSDKDELRKHNNALNAYMKSRLASFHNEFQEEGLEPRHKDMNCTSLTFEALYASVFTNYTEIIPSEYLANTVENSINGYIQQVFHNALSDLYSLPTDLISFQSQGKTHIKLPKLTLKLKIEKKDDPYTQYLESAKRVKSLAQNNTKIDEIIEGLLKPLSIRKLISNPPGEYGYQLEEIILSGDYEEEMASRLEKTTPGVLKHSIKNNIPNKRLFTDTADLRRQIKQFDNRFSSLNEEIDILSSAPDSRIEIQPLRVKLATIRTDLSKILNKEITLNEVIEQINKFKTRLNRFEQKIKRTGSNLSVDGSVFWVGLGQAGQQILRECILYSLDNIQDARCHALVKGLGIRDIETLKGELLKAKSIDGNVQKSAEKTMKDIFDRDLHILAMNLGGEIDKLVDPDEPGYYLWGNEKEEAEYSSVRRRTMNTIKLDPTQDGAGGKTGIGRAFAFGRSNEVEEALKDTANKGGRSPSHIIITHSFAGGSGSGMVLPVLQMIRSLFDSDAMIWVVSVGEGASENKKAASYNTPFILSDVLQAHYDGIHSPMDPFNAGEWEAISDDFKVRHTSMSAIMGEIYTLLSTGEAENKGELVEDIKQQSRNSLAGAKRKYETTLNSLKNSDLPKGLQFNTQLNPKLPVFEHITDFLPLSDDRREAFNEWCNEYDDDGQRPALDFWSHWIQSASDPLGTVIICKEKTQITGRARRSEDEREAFSPNLTSHYLAWAMNVAKLNLGITPGDEDKTRKRAEPEGVKIFAKYLADKVRDATSQDSTGREEAIGGLLDKLNEKLTLYGRELDAYNKLRRNLTKRVQALSRASNDMGIKSIVISNAHLERGVNAANIPVEEQTYTVYNAIVFDVVMNIIGSQLPSNEYSTGKMEYFDRQDLTNHTRPPMAVGLLQQQDAISLGEEIHVEKSYTTLQLMNKLFVAKEIFPGEENPFRAGADYSAGNKPAYFASAFFGVRMRYLLQHNPYKISNIEEQPKLVELAKKLIEAWDDRHQVILGSDYEERKRLEKEDSITKYEFTNLMRWFTTVDSEFFAWAMGLEELESLVPYWNNSDLEMDTSRIQSSSEVTRFERDSGNCDLTTLSKALPKLGILTEDLLASVSPSLLNSYLPYLILKENKEAIIADGSPRPLVEAFITYYHPSTNLFDKTNMGIASEKTGLISGFEQLKQNGGLEVQKQIFAKHNLSLEFGKNKDNKADIEDDYVLKISLHPRMHRFFSVIRDSIVDPGSPLFASKSVAGNIARYVSADSSNSPIGDYGFPHFVPSIDHFSRLGYVGLLPDETKFTFASLLRIVLLGESNDSDVVKSALLQLAKTSEMDIGQIIDDLVKIIDSEPYPDNIKSIYQSPIRVIGVAQVLLNRMKAMKQLVKKMQGFDTNTILAVSRWEEIVGVIEEELELSNEHAVRYFVQLMLSTIKQTDATDKIEIPQSDKISMAQEESNLPEGDSISNSEVPDLTDDEGYDGQPRLIERVIYEIVSELSEVLIQAEYMSKDHAADRVHFQMNGFTDRIIGSPSGLLVQVHTAETYRGNFDKVRKAIRGSIFESLGNIGDTKQFQTQSMFGPRASVTMTLQQAPIREAAQTFKRVMVELRGNDTHAYVKQTMLHPYAFLYNVLWLSARIDKWTSSENTEFARRFIIPLEVIQNHYSKPAQIQVSVKSLARDDVFRKGNITLPSVDHTDYQAEQNDPDNRYRSMRYLVSIMALRHWKALNQLDSEKAAVVEIEYNEQLEVLRKDEVLDRITSVFANGGNGALITSLEQSGPGGHDGGGKSSLFGNLLSDLNSNDSTQDEDEDTLLGRTLAWLTAYKSWNNFSSTRNNEE